MNEKNEDHSIEEMLDQLGRQSVSAPPYLASRIVASLPPRDAFQDFLTWLTASPWKGLASAALPILLGFVLGMQGTVAEYLDYDIEEMVYLNELEENGIDEI